MIFVAALLPALIALYIIYKKDSKNPEPTGLLAKAVFCPALYPRFARLYEDLIFWYV